MKLYNAVGLVVVTAAVFSMSGCSSDSDSSGSGSNLTGEPVVIATAADAQNAISSISATSEISGADNPAQAPSRSPSRAPVNETIQCSGGGTITTTGDADDYTVDVTQTFNNCIESGMTMNGSTRTTGTNNDGNIDLTIAMTNLKTESSDMSSVIDMTQNLKFNENIGDVMDMLFNGKATYTITSPSDSGKAGYENFHIVLDGNTLDIEGKVSSESSAHPCTNGIYSMDTTQPLYTSATHNGFDSGAMTINNTEFVFNSDGTATVTFEDGTTATVKQNQPIVCN